MTTEPILRIEFQNASTRDRVTTVLEIQCHLSDILDCTDITYTTPTEHTVQFYAEYHTAEELHAELAEYNARHYKEWWA